MTHDLNRAFSSYKNGRQVPPWLFYFSLSTRNTLWWNGPSWCWACLSLLCLAAVWQGFQVLGACAPWSWLSWPASAGGLKRFQHTSIKYISTINTTFYEILLNLMNILCYKLILNLWSSDSSFFFCLRSMWRKWWGGRGMCFSLSSSDWLEHKFASQSWTDSQLVRRRQMYRY